MSSLRGRFDPSLGIRSPWNLRGFGAVNEAPVAVGATLSIAENSTSAIGTVAASDPDGDTLTYSISDGDPSDKFSINASTGQLVATGSGLNYEDDTQHVLTITVSDSVLTGTATITVNVTNVNEAPVAVDNAFTIAENAGASSLGTVAATDVDGDTLTWSITAGNGSSLFTIDAANGALSTTGDLDYETAAQHVLTITVTDNGTGTLSDTATVTVTVTDVAEASAPTNEFVFDDDIATVQGLSMANSDWLENTPDMDNFGILARVTIDDHTVSGDKKIWDQWESGSTEQAFQFFVRGYNNYVFCRVKGSFGTKYIQSDVLAEGVETLLYMTNVDGLLSLYSGTGTDTPTLAASVAAVGTTNDGSGETRFGMQSPTAFGWNGTIHQPIFFAGGTIPTHEEIGTADTPVALSGHASVYSAPDADDLPNDEILSTAWTNNNSVTVQTH